MPATRSPFARFLLKFPLFILLGVVALIAIIAWRFLPERAVPLPHFTAPTEKHRSALKTELSKAIRAFYATPNSRNELDATRYIRDYRRSFPDAKPDGTDPSLTKCNIDLECARVRERQKKKIADLATSVPRAFPHRAQDNPEVQAALTEAYALDRELPTDISTRRIDDYARAYPKEGELLKFQAEFFRVIDEIAAAGDARPSGSGEILSQYVDKYIKLSWQSLKPIPQSCDDAGYRGSGAKDPAACNAAVAAHEAKERKIADDTRAYWKSFPVMPTNARAPEHQPFRKSMYLARAKAIKELLADRQAYQYFIRTRTGNLMHPL